MLYLLLVAQRLPYKEKEKEYEKKMEQIEMLESSLEKKNEEIQHLMAHIEELKNTVSSSNQELENLRKEKEWLEEVRSFEKVL